ncbi:MAG: hypothetical protein ACLU22_14380 [Clostridium sp.]
MSSYSYCQTLLEPPKYSLHNVYRALSVLAEESDFIQEELYRNSNFVHPRNTRVLYYDCTNYYFEIEEENGNKNMEKAKNTDQIRLLPWGFSWMRTESLSPSIFFRETRTNRSLSNRWKQK